MAAGSRVVIRPGSWAARAFTRLVMALLMIGSASPTIPTTSVKAALAVSTSPSTMPAISDGSTPFCSASATSAIAPPAASTRGWKAGISARPMLVFSASPAAVMRCMLSSKAPIFARFSSLNTAPIAAASAA